MSPSKHKHKLENCVLIETAALGGWVKNLELESFLQFEKEGMGL